MKTRMRWALGAVAMAAACATASAVWVRSRAEKPVEVTSVTASLGPIDAYVKATGTVDAPRELTIAAPQAARVLEMPFQVGSMVKRGQRIAQLDSAAAVERVRNAEAQLHAQEAQVRQAELDLQADQTVWRAGGQPRHAVEQAESRLALERSRSDAANSDLRAARLQQQAYTVSAPADGVVTSVSANAGEYVQAGAPLLTTAPQSVLEVRIKIDQGSADRIQIGQPVELSSDDAPDVVGHARISRIEPKIQKDGSGYYLVARAQLPGDGFAARLNQQLTVRILTASRPRALRVPLDAVTEKDGVDLVRVITESRLHLQAVKTGIQDAQRIEILEGLSPGQQVVLANAGQALAEGTLVQPAKTLMPARP